MGVLLKNAAKNAEEKRRKALDHGRFFGFLGGK